jgi:hypothetical protein
MPVDQKCASTRGTRPCGPATNVIDFEIPYEEGDISYDREEFFCKDHYDPLVKLMEAAASGDEAMETLLNEMKQEDANG